MYKHLLIIEDGELLENSFHLTETARAEALIEWAKDFSDGDHEGDLAEAMQEADEEAAQADYPEGVVPRALTARDYVDAVKEYLSNNRDVDVYLEDVFVPAQSDEVRTE